MSKAYKIIRNICVLFVGGITLMFLSAGIAAKNIPGVAAIILILSLIGLWPSKIAKSKNLGLTGAKLWFYTTFVPVVSWIDIALRPAVDSVSETISDPAVNAPEKTVKQYDEYLKKYNEKWEVWEMEHDKPEQRKRRLRSVIDCSIVKLLDKDNVVALIKGNKGGEYVTGLTMCNCMDFTKRHKPCKHMYCLAAYLKLFDPLSTI